MPEARTLALASIALSLAAANVEAAQASACAMVRVAEWPARSDRGHIVVDGTINGQRIAVLLDTGAETMIVRSAADRLGLTRRAVRGYRAFGIGGETYVERANVEEFRVGEITRRNWRVMVAGERDLGRSVDVILGEDFLDQVEVEFDLPHGAVRLFQSQDCEGATLAYWAAQSSTQVDLLPYYDAGQRIMVPVRVNGQPLAAEIDSGSNVSVLDQPVAEQLGIKPGTPGVVFAGKGGGLGGKSVDFWIGPLRSFAIGDETISDTGIRFADLWRDATYTPKASHLPRKIEHRPALLLGTDFLRAHRVLVAHSQRKLYFTYEGGPVFQPKTAGPADRPAPDETTAGPARGDVVARPVAN